MNEEKRQILEMVGEGKITQEDALRLLDALEEEKVDRAFEEAMAQLREEQQSTPPPQPRQESAPPQQNTPVPPYQTPPQSGMPPHPPQGHPYQAPPAEGPIEPEVLPKQENDIWGEMGEAAREVGQALSQTASATVDVISEGVQWAKGAVQNIPGVSLWWDGEQPMPDGEQPLPYHYPDGPAEVSKLDIEWVKGPVEIVPWDGKWVNVLEYAQRPLTEGEQLELTVTDGGTMRIRWTREKGFLKGLRLSKRLVVQVPAGAGMEKIKVENVSGSIRAESLFGEKFSFSTTSGRVEAVKIRAEKLKLASVSGSLQAEDVQAETLELGTTSGRIEAPGFGAESAKFTTVSGGVSAYGNAEKLSSKTVSGSILLQTAEPPEKVRLESVSGRITLLLPPNDGFTAEFETMSGSFTTGFPVSGSLDGKSGKAVYGDGGIEVSLNTLSGKMEVQPGEGA